MWFKQAQLFQLTGSAWSSPVHLAEKLKELEFRECLPSMPYTVGWVSPVNEEEAPLVQALSGYEMICLQVEEKILPPVVVRQELAKRIKQIEELENRKVGQKEKYALKEDITATLLPRAFSKLTKVYAYIDIKNHWLVLGTASAKKTEQFLFSFKRTLGDYIDSFQIKKLSGTMTSWLKHQNIPSSFSIERSCVLQDANHQSRVIRCHNQDLFANSIQSLIHDGCEITQLALNWKGHIDFVLLDDLSIQSIRFSEDIMAQVREVQAESKQQQFNADFFIMTKTLEGLFNDLLGAFAEQIKMYSKSHVENKVSMLKLA